MDDAYQHGMNPSYDGVHQRNQYDQSNGFQSQQYQEQSHGATQTLPPIQAQRPVLQHASHSYDSYYRPQGLQHGTSAAPYQSYYGQSMSQAPYSHGIAQYSTNAPFPPHTTQPSVNLEYASAPGANSLPILRPMPPSGFDADGRGGHDPNAARANPPRPVVGSQGRRGILPSDEGRPPVSMTDGDSASKANFNPAKGPDGKYACPHCPKTYLHAKHLKRHHLRHTGDRPYSCILCGETFSRSDILKRHFQKCSIRRGNPTGATHLSNSQSHLRKQGSKKPDGMSAGSAFSIVTPTDSQPYGSDTSRSLSNYSSSEQIKRYSDSAVLRDGRATLPSPVSNQSAFSLAGQKGPSSPSSGGSTPITSKKSGLSSASFTPEIPQQPQPQPQRMNSYNGELPSMPANAGGVSHLPRSPHGSDFANWPPFDHGNRDGDGDRLHMHTNNEHARHIDAEMKQGYPPPADEQQQHHDFISNFFSRGGNGGGDGMNVGRV